MDKLRFETYLRDRLAVLKDDEIDEIISEYLQHIDMRIKDGTSEEKAINDFGDLNVLVEEILDAYKIDTNNNQFEDFGNTVKGWLNQAFDYIGNISKSIMQRSPGDILVLVIEFIVVLVMIRLMIFGVDVVSNVLMRMFYYRSSVIIRTFRMLIRLLSSIFSLFVSLTILYWFANERILKYKNTNKDVPKDKKQYQDNSNKYKTDVKSKTTVVDAKDGSTINKIVTPMYSSETIEDKEGRRAKKMTTTMNASETVQRDPNKKTFADILFAGNMLILKVVMFIILIPMIVVGVFGGIAWVVVVYNTVIGYGSFGVSLILSGVLIIYYYMLILGLKLVGGGKAS